MSNQDLVWISSLFFRIKIVFFWLFKGIFYDDTYDNIVDYVSYAVDIVNKNIKSSSGFKFEYSIYKVAIESTFKITNKRLSIYSFFSILKS